MSDEKKISIKRQKIIEKAVDKMNLKWSIFIGQDDDHFIEFYAIAADEESHALACAIRDMIFKQFEAKMMPPGKPANKLPI